ncbi:hypothetical protein ACWD0J_17730 [Streptomyces sp. NPDC003011]
MTAGWGMRTVRAAVFAAVCVVLAALGHVTMSGSSVPWWSMAAGAVVTGGTGWCLAGRERGLPLIVAVVVAAQTLLHLAFEFAQSAAPLPTAGSSPVPRGAMDMDSTARDMGSVHMGSAHMDAVHMDAVHIGFTHPEHRDAGQMAHMGHDMDGTSSFGMLAAHLLAALLCGLWLAHGERAAFRILRTLAGWLAAPLRLLLALPTPPHRPRIRVRRRSDWAPRRFLLVHAITSRGPPVGPAVV